MFILHALSDGLGLDARDLFVRVYQSRCDNQPGNRLSRGQGVVEFFSSFPSMSFFIASVNISLFLSSLFMVTSDCLILTINFYQNIDKNKTKLIFVNNSSELFLKSKAVKGRW